MIVKTASANLTNGKIYVNSFSLSIDGVWLISPPYYRFDIDISINILGTSILEALEANKFGIPHPKEFNNIGKDFISAVKLKSFKQLQIEASKECNISMDDKILTIQALINAGKGKGFISSKSKPIEPITLSKNASAMEIGNALLEGFARAIDSNMSK